MCIDKQIMLQRYVYVRYTYLMDKVQETLFDRFQVNCVIRHLLPSIGGAVDITIILTYVHRYSIEHHNILPVQPYFYYLQ